MWILITAILTLMAPLVWQSLPSFLAYEANFFALFYTVTRHFIPSASAKPWTKFVGVILAVSIGYAMLGAATGDLLLSTAGLTRVARLPPDTPSFLVGLPSPYLLFLVGLSLCQNGLMILSFGYLAQKYVVRMIYRLLKQIYRDHAFFLRTAENKKPISVVWYTLWMLLLPLPIQSALSINAAEALAIHAIYLFPAVLAIFVLWGLKAAPVVGITKDRVLTASEMVGSSLFWFTALRWVTLIGYAFVTQATVASAIVTIIRGFVRAFILFLPIAVTIVYFYVNFLEARAEVKIVDYLSKKEALAGKVLTIRAE